MTSRTEITPGAPAAANDVGHIVLTGVTLAFILAQIGLRRGLRMAHPPRRDRRCRGRRRVRHADRDGGGEAAAGRAHALDGSLRADQHRAVAAVDGRPGCRAGPVPSRRPPRDRAQRPCPLSTGRGTVKPLHESYLAGPSRTSPSRARLSTSPTAPDPRSPLPRRLTSTTRRQARSSVCGAQPRGIDGHRLARRTRRLSLGGPLPRTSA